MIIQAAESTTQLMLMAMNKLWNILRQNMGVYKEMIDFLGTVEEYDFQEAEMIEAFVDFQNDLLFYGIEFELRNEVE